MECAEVGSERGHLQRALTPHNLARVWDLSSYAGCSGHACPSLNASHTSFLAYGAFACCSGFKG
eukprot:625541-Alexandrium_andersonii.AAC.1